MYDSEAPDDWLVSSVYDLARWKNGLAFRDINFCGSGRPVIKIAELKGGITHQTKFTNDQFDDAVRVIAGDFLFSWSGNPDTSIDIFRWAGGDGWLNQHIFKVHPQPVVDREFFFFMMKWLRPRFAEIARNKQTTGLGHVTIADLKRMSVGVPSIDEQRRLVDVLGPIQEKLDLNLRMNATLEGMARAIFKDWFVDFGPVRAKAEGRRPPGLADDIAALFPDKLDDDDKPMGWEFGSLSNYTDLKNGFAFSSSAWQTTGVPVVKIGSVRPSVVDLSNVSFVTEKIAEERSSFRLSPGDILVGLTGYVGEVGRVPPSDKSPLLNQRVACFRPRSCYAFVYACVRQPTFKYFAEMKSHGSAQPNVSHKDLLTFPLVIAPDPLVAAFEQIVSHLFEKSLENHGEIHTLTMLRDLLLPKLMSGEVQLKDTEKALEAVA